LRVRRFRCQQLECPQVTFAGQAERRSGRQPPRPIPRPQAS
jgi:hypothetical protein